MTQYNIPFDMKFEDKILGGKLTLKQFAYYVPALILGGMLITHSSAFAKKAGTINIDFGLLIYYIVIEIILLLIATVFAFTKVNGDSLAGYLIKKLRFLLRKRVIRFYK